MSEKIFSLLESLIPQHFISRFMGRLGNCHWRWFKNFFIQTFINLYHVNMSEALEPDPKKYATFNDFFTRALKPTARTIVAGDNEIACPADGFISQIGQIANGKIFQAKNFYCDLKQLLADSNELTALFQNGNFVTVYLAPKNYHRVHIPYTGTLRKMIYVPGKLFPVKVRSVNYVPNLFARNERVISFFETEAGPMAVILVGAMIVGSIETVWAGEITPSKSHQIQEWNYENSSIKLSKGEELGRFKMGSTAIVLFGPNHVTWTPTLQPEYEVRLGQLLGIIK